jgi:hypothetical protein
MKDQIKSTILDLLQKNSDYSFAELIFELENNSIDVTGDQNIFLKENLILWQDVNSDFTDAINELLSEEKIALNVLKGSEAVLIYSYSDSIPTLPVAEDSKKSYKKPHWLPTIIKRKLR